MSSAVREPETQYTQHKPLWQQCRDAVVGDTALKARDVQKPGTYVPRLPGMSKDEYAAYLKRGKFYNATQKTIEALVGNIFRLDPTVDLPPVLTDYETNATLTGRSLIQFARRLTTEILTVGRGGILVDYPRNDARDLTEMEAEQMGMRPYIQYYTTESILGYRTSTRNNKEIVTMVRLLEQVSAPEPEDEFSEETIEQVRVLDLDESGLYRQRIYREQQDSDGNMSWMLVEIIEPVMNNARMDTIPFTFVSPSDLQPTYSKPPILDLVQVNLSHYLTTVEQEHSQYLTAHPQPWATGVSEEEVPTSIGGAEIWHTSNPEAKFGLLEYQGKGLETFEKSLARKQEYMAYLGDRMLAPEKRAAEAAETLRLRSASEDSILASMAMNLSEALTVATQTVAQWMQAAEDDVNIQLNTDYQPTRLSPQEVQVASGLLQAGQWTLENYYQFMKQGEWIVGAESFEDWAAEIQTLSPATLEG